MAELVLGSIALAVQLAATGLDSYQKASRFIDDASSAERQISVIGHRLEVAVQTLRNFESVLRTNQGEDTLVLDNRNQSKIYQNASKSLEYCSGTLEEINKLLEKYPFKGARTSERLSWAVKHSQKFTILRDALDKHIADVNFQTQHSVFYREERQRLRQDEAAKLKFAYEERLRAEQLMKAYREFESAHRQQKLRQSYYKQLREKGLFSNTTDFDEGTTEHPVLVDPLSVKEDATALTESVSTKVAAAEVLPHWPSQEPASPDPEAISNFHTTFSDTDRRLRESTSRQADRQPEEALPSKIRERPELIVTKEVPSKSLPTQESADYRDRHSKTRNPSLIEIDSTHAIADVVSDGPSGKQRSDSKPTEKKIDSSSKRHSAGMRSKVTNTYAPHVNPDEATGGSDVKTVLPGISALRLEDISDGNTPVRNRRKLASSDRHVASPRLKGRLHRLFPFMSRRRSGHLMDHRIPVASTTSKIQDNGHQDRRDATKMNAKEVDEDVRPLEGWLLYPIGGGNGSKESSWTQVSRNRLPLSLDNLIYLCKDYIDRGRIVPQDMLALHPSQQQQVRRLFDDRRNVARQPSTEELVIVVLEFKTSSEAGMVDTESLLLVFDRAGLCASLQSSQEKRRTYKDAAAPAKRGSSPTPVEMKSVVDVVKPSQKIQNAEHPRGRSRRPKPDGSRSLARSRLSTLANYSTSRRGEINRDGLGNYGPAGRRSPSMDAQASSPALAEGSVRAKSPASTRLAADSSSEVSIAEGMNVRRSTSNDRPGLVRRATSLDTFDRYSPRQIVRERRIRESPSLQAQLRNIHQRFSRSDGREGHLSTTNIEPEVNSNPRRSYDSEGSVIYRERERHDRPDDGSDKDAEDLSRAITPIPPQRSRSRTCHGSRRGADSRSRLREVVIERSDDAARQQASGRDAADDDVVIIDDRYVDRTPRYFDPLPENYGAAVTHTRPSTRSVDASALVPYRHDPLMERILNAYGNPYVDEARKTVVGEEQQEQTLNMVREREVLRGLSGASSDTSSG